METAANMALLWGRSYRADNVMDHCLDGRGWGGGGGELQWWWIAGEGSGGGVKERRMQKGGWVVLQEE